jgi:hypothetical protein
MVRVVGKQGSVSTVRHSKFDTPVVEKCTSPWKESLQHRENWRLHSLSSLWIRRKSETKVIRQASGPTVVVCYVLILRKLPYVVVVNHGRWVPCHHGMTHLQVTDGGDALQVLRVTTNIWNKQSRTTDKGWSSSLQVTTKSQEASSLMNDYNKSKPDCGGN